MRTKTVLLAATALAAGVISSQAQSNVYSANIVGYVNVPAISGLSFHSNPLDANTGNSALKVIPNTGQWDTCEIQQWTGINYSIAVFDSLTDDTTTGFTDRIGNPVPAPNLNSGVGYFFNNQTGLSNTVTYVGTVRTGTNIITLASSPALSVVGSALPYAGGISSALGLVNAGGSLDTCEIQIPNINAGGAVASFSVAVFDSLTDDTTTGFTDRIGNPVPEPVIQVGHAFFFNNQSGSPIAWKTVLNP